MNAAQIFDAMCDGKIGRLAGWREIYRDVMPEIEFRYPHQAHPYFCSWHSFSTPIEDDIWYSIRALDLPLYPQFPVKRYLIDFADPIKKIAVECDGKAFHQDKSKDAARDADLKRDGWRVFRIPGVECRRCGDRYDWGTIAEAVNNARYDNPETAEEFERQAYKDWLTRSGDGVIHAIAHRFYLRCEGLTKHVELVRASLNAHEQ